jgi:hypothetical protein
MRSLVVVLAANADVEPRAEIENDYRTSVAQADDEAAQIAADGEQAAATSQVFYGA